MIETEQSAERRVDEETLRRSIAMSYVRAWQKLSPGAAGLLGIVLPVLASHGGKEDQAIRLIAEALGHNHPDAHRSAWKGLKKAAISIHRAKVQHRWYQWNPEENKEQKCGAELVWTKEVRTYPVERQVELVFYPGLSEYLPAILRRISDFQSEPPTASVSSAANDSLIVYIQTRHGPPV